MKKQPLHIKTHHLLFWVFAFLSVTTSTYGQAYIHLHLRALNEESSPTFSYQLTTPSSSTANVASLRDLPSAKQRLYDLGADAGGGMFVVAADATLTDGNYGAIYYRSSGTSTWVAIGSEAIHVDGGQAGAYVSLAKSASPTNGFSDQIKYRSSPASSEVNITGNLSGNAFLDVSDNWNGTRYVLLADGSVYKSTGTTSGNTWTSTGASSVSWIDAVPNTNKLVGVAYISGTYFVFRANNDLTSFENLGNPTATNEELYSVSATGDGTVWVITGGSPNGVPYRYTGSGWVKSTSIIEAPFATAGPGNQFYVAQTGYDGIGMPGRIYAHTNDDEFIDDQRIYEGIATNTAVLKVDGTATSYQLTQTPVAGWHVTDIRVAGATVLAKNLATGTVTISLPVGTQQNVHIEFENQLTQITTIPSSCSGTAFKEDFSNIEVGTSGMPLNEGFSRYAASTYGNVLTGLTSYHKADFNFGFGYYGIVSNSSDAGGYAISMFDHTSGNSAGKMMMVDAAYEKGIFYRRRFTNLQNGVKYNFSAWIANVNGQGAFATAKPNVSFELYNATSGVLLTSVSSGTITAVGKWTPNSLIFTSDGSDIELVLRNNTLGTLGNDLTIDDISFSMSIPDIEASITGTCITSGQQGQIVVTAPLSTGTGDNTYEYSINGTNWQSTTTFSGLAAGTYTVYVRYKNTSSGCQTSKVIVINNADCPYTIAGNVLNDGNGLTDNTVNTSGTGALNPVNGTNLNGTPLYASLLNSSNQLIATVPVTSSGTYSFSNVANGTYLVVLTINSAGSTTSSLPASWTSVGEHIGTGTGSDGTANGILTGITVSGGNVSNANLGINKQPTATTSTDISRANPGGTSTSPVSATVFGGTDSEDGTYTNNLTGRTVTLYPATGATLYYNGSPVSGSTVVTSFDPTKVSIDPTNTGATSVNFTYSVADNAGTSSPLATVIIPFTAPVVSLSGNVWNDADGSLSQNGPETGTNAGGPLFVNLVNATGTVIGSTTVSASGAYNLTSVPANTTGLKLVLTSSPTSNVPGTLPTGWVNTGENVGSANTATQSATLGQIELSTGTTDLTGQNFGIEQLPLPGSGTATVTNAGGSSPVPVPPSAFTNTSPSTDSAPGSVTAIHLTSFPSNVTSLTINGNTYTAGSFPAGGVVVATTSTGAPTVPILVDPTNDSNPVSFSFTAIDNAGKESITTGTAVLSFTGVADLTPIIYARPSTVYQTTTMSMVVDVVELLGVPTSGLITVRVSKDAKMPLVFPPSASSLGGRSVQNSVWSFDGSTNPSYYILTTSSVVSAGDKLSFGLAGVLTPGATTGALTTSAVIVGGSGGEVRIDNNVDADKVDYFQQ